eukprot:TRINITY_DN2327_c0_g1_i1.p1 TRINITY_DN2327_c0_g1~~TRINITY_DN2327_c0_g1_i1.p1  ORF type:complete len:258 (-),score=41.55 TRINITY_DN2327_c0_g1_i1:31-804(-)
MLVISFAKLIVLCVLLVMVLGKLEGEAFIDYFHTNNSDFWIPFESDEVMDHIPKVAMLPTNLHFNAPLEGDPKGENGLVAFISDKPCSDNPKACCVNGHCANISGSHLETNITFLYGTFEIYLRTSHNQSTTDVSSLTCLSTFISGGNEIDACFGSSHGLDKTIHCTYFSPEMIQKKIPLDFDPGMGYHTYAFLWQKESIEWFVDGKSVYKVTGQPQKGGIPWMPQRIVLTYRPLDPNFVGTDSIDIGYIKYTPLAK